MSAVVIRPVEERDADALGNVHVRCWWETYDHLLSGAALSQLHPEHLADMWRRIPNLDAEYRSFTALVDDDVVGFAGSGPARDDDKSSAQELYFIYVLRSHHGTGIAQQLMDAVLEPGPAYLWVAAVNPRAQQFYARNGFMADGQEKEEGVFGELLHQVRLVR